MSTEATPFGAVDYVVFSAMLGISAITGIYHGCKNGGQKSTSQYLVADKSMNAIPIAMSLFVSFLSALTILGMPAETFIYGAQYTMLVLSYVWLLPVVAFLYVPVFQGLNLISAYEYFGMRFNYTVRITGVILFALQTLFYIAVVLIGPAVAVEAVMKIDIWITVFVTGVICVFYTTLGGMQAVIWTDVFQFLVIFGTIITVIVMGTLKAGGVEYVWEVNKNDGRLDVFSFPFDLTERTTFLGMVIGGGMNTFSSYISQTAVQRYVSSKSLRQAQMSVLLLMPFQFIILPLVMFSGLVMYAFYNDYLMPLQPAINATFPPDFPTGDGTDPCYTPDYTSSDQILVYFISAEFGSIPGIQGLFVSCLFAGTLSTMSSSLNALIAVTLEDIVKPWRRWRAFKKRTEVYENDARDTVMSKILMIVYGVISIGLTYLASYMGSLVTMANTIFGTFGGPLLGAFTLGMFYKRANSWGTLIGELVGFGLGVWVSVGAIIYADMLDEVISFYKLSFMWYSAFTFLCTIVLGILCSELLRCFIKEERHKKVDPLLLATFLRPKVKKTPKSMEINEADEEIIENLDSDLYDKIMMNDEFSMNQYDMGERITGVLKID
ncbi:sodium-dependent multivitamin transporter-like [Glandiceps talaboti]